MALFFLTDSGKMWDSRPRLSFRRPGLGLKRLVKGPGRKLK